jgi:SAM-dependent MidA family methyltransferase
MSNEALVCHIRALIQREGPISFDRFMEQALYHPDLGYYSSGRCAIGRGGDYFTSVSVGPLFGQLLSGQFAQIWERLGQPDEFTILEQGAHQGEFAFDLLEALREQKPDLFARVRYQIVEPFVVLGERQRAHLQPFCDRIEWTEALETTEPFVGVHFSNELVDAMPVHLLVGANEDGRLRWCERRVEQTSHGFAFLPCDVADPGLRAHLDKIPGPPAPGYETEVNLSALEWIERLAGKLERGVVLIADYGLVRSDFYAPSRRTGTLQSYSQHRVLSSPLEQVGDSDLTTHVEWTSLAEQAEASGLRIAGFADQHHFLTGLLAMDPELRAIGTEKGRALQTLIHPEFLGTRFQFLGLTKNFPEGNSLSGFRFARNPRLEIGLTTSCEA